MEQLTTPPIESVFIQSRANEAIDLGTEVIEYPVNENIQSSPAKVRLTFDRGERLQFEVAISDADPFFGMRVMHQIGKKLTLVNRDIELDVFCSSAGTAGIILVPNRSNATVTKPSTTINRVTFHILNFPAFRNSEEDFVLKSGDSEFPACQACGRVTLESSEWIATISAVADTHEAEKELKNQGGYRLTHVGEFFRSDGSDFTTEQADDFLGCLHYFLSFATGRWSGVCLPIGVDVSGQIVFQQWGMRLTADGPWNSSTSWFDSLHGYLLKETFVGFCELWNSSIWREPLQHAIYWMLAANDRRVGIGVDTGLILSQTAFELLAWTRCVLDEKTASKRNFKPGGWSAAKKLRFLASSLNIPCEIPEGLDSLQPSEPTESAQIQDSLTAITRVRNSLVHPDNDRSIPDGAYYDAWRLSMWYLDVVLLRLCGHTGRYSNRLKERFQGTIEELPKTGH